MFDHIVVPLDGSKLAECVLPHVTSVALASHKPVTLLHVVAPDEAGASVDPLQWRLRKMEREAYLEEVRARLQDANVPAQAVIVEGAAAKQITDYAHAQGRSLLVLSSHGRSGLGRWNVSGVVEKVIQEIRTSLLLVRAYQQAGDEAPTPGYRRIMVPLDGSKRAECTLPLAESLARHWDAELLLTHVVRQPHLFQMAPLSADDKALLGRVVARHRTEAAGYFDRLQARLPVRARVHLAVEDDVIIAFNDIVRHEGVDLILFSAHGHGCSRFQRYGSLVSCYILYGSAPILIVQDLPAEQVEPTAAERAVSAEEPEAVRQPTGTSADFTRPGTEGR
jgi:nucleotide-binding universal stress UspA family protein